MKYYYLGYIDNQSELNQLIDYPLKLENRIDKNYMRFYRYYNDQSIIYYEIFKPVKGINNMQSIADKLNAIKTAGNGNIDNNQTSERKKTMQSLADKLKAKKQGIVKQSTELTIDKFAKVEHLEKMINNQSELINKLMEKVDLMNNDHLTMANYLKGINDMQSENNGLLVGIAKGIQSNATKAQNTVINRKQAPITPENALNANKTAMQAPATGNGNADINQLYSVFMKNFNAKFSGSKNTDKTIDFQNLINAIDITSPDTIAKTMSKEWTRNRETNNQFYWAAKFKSKAINAMVAALNTMGLINDTSLKNTSINSEVKNRDYWVKFYGINQSDITELMDIVKSHGMTKDVKELINEHLEQIATIERKSNNQFINWLELFVS